jgi:hypothetical protein
MTTFDNTNRGSIRKNDKKSTDKHPDFTGELNVDGNLYWVSAWKRKADAHPNAPALSFSVKKKEMPDHVKKAAAVAPFADDDLPF